MSDITHSVRALAILDEIQNTSTVQVAVLASNTHATLAVAKAVREVYDVIKYVGRMNADANRPVDGPVDWITWEHDDRLHALSVRTVQGFSDDGKGGSVVSVMGIPEAILIPVSYGTIASMVGVV